MNWNSIRILNLISICCVLQTPRFDRFVGSFFLSFPSMITLEWFTMILHFQLAKSAQLRREGQRERKRIKGPFGLCSGTQKENSSFLKAKQIQKQKRNNRWKWLLCLLRLPLHISTFQGNFLCFTHWMFESLCFVFQYTHSDGCVQFFILIQCQCIWIELIRKMEFVLIWNLNNPLCQNHSKNDDDVYR